MISLPIPPVFRTWLSWRSQLSHLSEHQFQAGRWLPRAPDGADPFSPQQWKHRPPDSAYGGCNTGREPASPFRVPVAISALPHAECGNDVSAGKDPHRKLRGP